MSGETEAQVSGWTVDTLHTHLIRQIDNLKTLLDERNETQRREVLAALTSAEKAVTKAETAAEKRFEAVNEFRGQLADQAATLLTRNEADVKFGALEEKVTALTDRVNQDQGRNAGSEGYRTNKRADYLLFVAVGSALIAATSIVVSVVLATGR